VGLLMSGALSDDRSRLQFTDAARPRKIESFSGPSSAGLSSYFTVSLLKLPQPAEPGSCIYFFQEQVSPVIPPSIGLEWLSDVLC
jgi:hypothetical protein